MKYKITLKGRTYEVEVERGEAMILDEYEALAPAAPAAPAPAPASVPAAAPAAPAATATASGTVVSAPLPGNILAIQVKEGDAVKEGQVLVLIEAMKMENEVMAPADGVVKQIAVTKGAVVATGDTLLVI
ncbi:MAG: biotin/lipoyl-containing protein [Oscillospiraceae bacterium]